jgi:PadR family transcriptional regulator
MLPKNFLRRCLLLLLGEQPAHGYDLMQRLRAFEYDSSDPGALYRALRTLQDDGLVHPTRERSDSGPARRRYELTRAGWSELDRQSGSLAATTAVFRTFLSRYEEFVALRDTRRHAPDDAFGNACRPR